MAKVIKSKCLGCGICSGICPEGIEVVDGKAKIKNENADCLMDAANACPQKAIIIERKENKKEDRKSNQNNEENLKFGLNQDRNMKRSVGRGRGLGIGFRHGRGRGRGKKF